MSLTYDVSPASVSVAKDGGRDSITVRTAPTQGWAPFSSDSWLTLGNSLRFVGSGTFTWVASPNAGYERKAFIYVGDVVVEVTQAGEVVPSKDQKSPIPTPLPPKSK